MLLLAAGIWVAGGLPAAANDEAAQAVTTDSSIEEADLMLDRGDSLLTLNKPVAALSMYRGAVERTFDPCQQARAQVGIAQIYTDSNNPNLALAALEQAQRGFWRAKPNCERASLCKPPTSGCSCILKTEP